MNKKTIIAICAAGGALILAIAGWLIFTVVSNTNEAKAAAAEFTTLLQAGELETLSLEYYTYSTEENKVYTDEDGQAQVQLVTPQQMAEIFGVEAVRSKEESKEEQVLKTIMKYTQMQTSVGTAFGSRAQMVVKMSVPDIRSWLENLTEEDIAYINSLTEGFLEDLESRMASGQIENKYQQFAIPMVKQNGKWRFDVTEEIEHAFFGGIYDVFSGEE